MLKLPRTRGLATEFGMQWLQVRDILDHKDKSEKLFPTFDDKLRHAFFEESALFFQDMFQNDRSVLNLIDADYTFVNDTLAKHYGLADVTKCIGLAPRTVCTFADTPRADALVVRSIVQQEMIKRGVLFLVGHNLCYAHSDNDVEHTLRAHRSALEILAKALDSKDPATFLEGEPVQAVFRRA